MVLPKILGKVVQTRLECTALQTGASHLRGRTEEGQIERPVQAPKFGTHLLQKFAIGIYQKDSV